MNIVVEDQAASCQKRLKVEVPADRVNREVERVTQDFQKHAKIPGFRPGKVPRIIIEKRFTQEIDEELKRSFVPQAFREAVRTKDLKVIGSAQIEDLKYQRGLSLSFSILVELSPEFNLPDYKSFRLPKSEVEVVTEDEVDKTLHNIATQYASYQPIENRAVQTDDFVVVDYTTQVDGKPLLEAIPSAPANLAENKNLWVWINPDSFLPGFTEQLLGMQAGEKREVSVQIPETFGVAELKGSKIHFLVQLHSIKQRILPTLDDAFAQEQFKVSLEEMRKQIKHDLNANKIQQKRNEQMKQLAEWLENAVHFDLPPSLVDRETQRIIHDIVRQNQNRGVADEKIEENKQGIFDSAAAQARLRVKLGFLLDRIAREEKIEVTEQEIGLRIAQMSRQYEMPPQKILERLEKAGTLDTLENQLLHEKTLDFLLKLAIQEPIHG